MRVVLGNIWPNTIAIMDKETCLQLLKDVCYLDRMIRLETHGEEEEEKEILSQEFQLQEGLAETNYHNNVEQIKQLN